MGTKGEIYNVLGLVVSAELVEKDKLYRVNGRTVATCQEYEDSADFKWGSWLGDVSREDPKLKVRILGHTESRGSRHFDGRSLVGYVVANESYWAHATPLPSMKDIEELKPELVADIKKRLGLDVQPSQLELYLVYDWDQSDQR